MGGEKWASEDRVWRASKPLRSKVTLSTGQHNTSWRTLTFRVLPSSLLLAASCQLPARTKSTFSLLVVDFPLASLSLTSHVRVKNYILAAPPKLANVALR